MLLRLALHLQHGCPPTPGSGPLCTALELGPFFTTQGTWYSCTFVIGLSGSHLQRLLFEAQVQQEARLG